MIEFLLILVLIFIAFLLIVFMVYTETKSHYTGRSQGGSSHNPITKDPYINIDFTPLSKKEERVDEED